MARLRPADRTTELSVYQAAHPTIRPPWRLLLEKAKQPQQVNRVVPIPLVATKRAKQLLPSQPK